MPYVSSFDQQPLIYHILVMNCNKAITIFKITTVKFPSLQNFTKQQKCPNLGLEMPVLDVLDWNLETMLPYLKSAPSNLSSWKTSRKSKNA